MDIHWQYALGLALVMASVSSVRIPSYLKDNKTQLLDGIGKRVWVVFLIWGFFEFTWWKPFVFSLAWLALIGIYKAIKGAITEPIAFLLFGTIVCLHSLGIFT